MTHTRFCLYLMASLSRAKFIFSVCSPTGPSGSLFKITSNSCEPRVCSNKSTANSVHCLAMDSYSSLNSFSSLLKRLSSQLSSNAVNMGSLLDRQIRDGLTSARYAFMRDREWFKLSSTLLPLHSTQLQRISCGLAIRSPRSRRILRIS